jgi:hypothetical protein
VDLRSICASYAFLEYSTCYWSFHAGHIRDRNDNSEDSLLKLVCEKYKTHPVFHKLVEWEQYVRSKIGSYVTRHNDTYWYVCLDLDISAWSVEAYSLLHVMASHGLHHYLRRLLELTDHEVDSRDCDELTALFHAAQNGHPKTVKLLLEQGAKFNSEKYSTPALKNHHVSRLIFLIRKTHRVLTTSFFHPLRGPWLH